LRESDLSRPLVTIVTPSYNQGGFIREAIESALRQDYPRIEYLVVDGGSTDETLSILREYTNQIEWISEPDRGQSSAINKGWRRGKGEILAWLNSDDAYLPGAISRAVSYLEDHPDLGAVYGEGYHVDEVGRVLERYPTGPFDLERLKETCFICQPTVFVRRAVIEQVGYLDESLHFCMDYDLWIRLARIARFGYVPEYLATSRLHEETKTLSRRREVYAEVLRMLHGHFGYVPPSWVYANAKVLAEAGRPPQSGWQQARFLFRLAVAVVQTFLRYNRRVPVAELFRWRHTWGRAWHALTQSYPGRR
jgi:glycosyltransferase involved in cell wall biosynthesis